MEGGADGVSVINTITGMAIDARTRRPRIATIFGGLSGPAIKPIALRMVYQVHRALPDMPICGIGGIANGEDAVEFLLAGATTVQVGTQNFVEPHAARRIRDELEAFCARRRFRTCASSSARSKAAAERIGAPAAPPYSRLHFFDKFTASKRPRNRPPSITLPSEVTLKKIEAIIKPFKLDEVKEALARDRRARHDRHRGQRLRAHRRQEGGLSRLRLRRRLRAQGEARDRRQRRDGAPGRRGHHERRQDRPHRRRQDLRHARSTK